MKHALKTTLWYLLGVFYKISNDHSSHDYMTLTPPPSTHRPTGVVGLFLSRSYCDFANETYTNVTYNKRCCFLYYLVSNLPQWLQSLIMCCFEVSEFDIQSSAVGTLLDLINLTLSVSAGHAHGPKPSAPVVVVPMISKQSLGVIEKSDLYEVYM